MISSDLRLVLAALAFIIYMYLKKSASIQPRTSLSKSQIRAAFKNTKYVVNGPLKADPVQLKKTGAALRAVSP